LVVAVRSRSSFAAVGSAVTVLRVGGEPATVIVWSAPASRATPIVRRFSDRCGSHHQPAQNREHRTGAGPRAASRSWTRRR